MHAVLFDIDGTLVLTGGAGQTAFQQTLTEEFGIGDIGRKVTFAGRSDRAIAMDLFRLHGVEVSDANWQRFRDGYLARLPAAIAQRQGEVLRGVRSLLDVLGARSDILVGLLTGNIREGAQRKLSHYDLWHYFPFGGFGDEHLDRNDIAADAFRAAIEFGGSSIDGTVVVIGDTINDIRCARSIGATAVAVPTGNSPADTLRREAPDLLVDTLEESAAILELFP